MNKIVCHSIAKTEEYHAPMIIYCSVYAEMGFQASLPNISIAPWESDDDSLEF